jgi:hypothetical protein
MVSVLHALEEGEGKGWRKGGRGRNHVTNPYQLVVKRGAGGVNRQTLS